MKTLFLDFGNVVAHFDHMRACRQLAAFSDLSADELFAAIYNGPLELAYEAGRISTAEFVAGAIAAGKLTCTPDEFLARFVDIFTPNPDVCGLIPRLAERYRLVLASNTNDAHFAKYTDQLRPTLRHFAHLGTSHFAGARKPDFGFYSYLRIYAMADPGECLFIDDIPANVAAAERFAGFRGLVYAPGDRFADKLRAVGVEVG